MKHARLVTAVSNQDRMKEGERGYRDRHSERNHASLIGEQANNRAGPAKLHRELYFQRYVYFMAAGYIFRDREVIRLRSVSPDDWYNVQCYAKIN